MKHLFFAALALILFSTSCEKIDEFFTYDVLVVNNTADALKIYESKEGGTFHKIGEVDPNSTEKEKGFIIDINYRLEARTSAGVVISTIDVRGDKKDDEKEWVID